MLKTFKIRNFKSILDETFSFEYAEDKAPNGYKDLPEIAFIENQKGARVVPLLMVFGANAAGKSNLINAVQVFQKVIKEGINATYYRQGGVFGSIEQSQYFPNKLNTKYNSTYFEVDFFIGNDEYVYSLEYNAVQIVSEELYRNKRIVFSIKGADCLNFENIVNKEYGVSDVKNVFQVECCSGKNQIKSFLNKIVGKYPGLAETLSKAQDYLFNKIYAPQAISYIPKDDNALQAISEIITRLDIDITRIERDKKYDGSTKFISYHKDINGNEIPFDFDKDESAGTNFLLHRLVCALSALETGSALFIDEIDMSLHPLLVDEIIKMFKSKESNSNNAQLIITAHNPYILENKTIRVSEVAFANKTLKNGTRLKYLYQFDDVRNSTDFVKRYLEGRLTGIPLVY
ncbi:MAG: ATP-binding protein [Endomicrobia bacterium]|nr:ATP-binding protein [Endomicrobiia bacterium]